jgi:glutathione S-transferase
MQDGELVVWDSLAIMEYLSDKYLEGRGWPADEKARAVARSVSAEMHSSFANVRSEMPMNLRKHFPDYQLSEAALREVGRIKSLWRLCREQYGQGGEWLFGDYSIADAMYAPIVMRFVGYDVPLEGIEKAYAESVLKQPAIQEWIEAGKAEIEVIAEDEI